jgi:hypothetical protein
MLGVRREGVTEGLKQQSKLPLLSPHIGILVVERRLIEIYHSLSLCRRHLRKTCQIGTYSWPSCVHRHLLAGEDFLVSLSYLKHLIEKDAVMHHCFA